MLSEYLNWWARHMRQWLPAGLAGGDNGFAHALVIEAVEAQDGSFGRIEAVLRRQRRDRNLGPFDLDGPGLRALQAAVSGRRPPATVLRLPPALLLEREVLLPLAAEREPERVLAYEMDRITPFSSAEVFWTYAAERRDRARGRLHLRLSVVTRVAVQSLLEALGRAGLAPTVLEVPSSAGPVRRIAMQRPDSRRERLARTARIAAASGCAVLAAAAVAVPFARQSAALSRVDRRMEALRPQVAQAEALRRQIAASTASVDVVAAERARVGDALAVLAAVTELLPDDTVLTDFTLRQGKLTISGQSAAAARLIAAMSADPVIRNPDFAASVTRIDNGRADLFSIRAEIAP